MKKKNTIIIVIIILILTVFFIFNNTTKKKDEKLKIGIIQYATHSSLDDCYKGIIDGLSEDGYIDGQTVQIDYKNAYGEQQNSDLIAQNMAQSNYDIIFAIATPAAMSSYSATKDTKIPVIFTAVTDPVSAGIVESNENPSLGITGTSDVIDYDQQLQMIRDFLPSASKIGIVYTLGEANAISNLESITSLANKYNFEIISLGINSSSEIATATETLVNKDVDCFCLLTDNNIADNISTLLNITDSKKIPVFARDDTQVDAGCIATLAINYYDLGKQTAKMGYKILHEGKDVNELPVEVINNYNIIYNKEKCLEWDIQIPEKYR